MGYAYANLTKFQNTGAGVAEYVLLAPVPAFAVDGIKCPAAPFTLPGDEVTVKLAHEFLTNEGFIKVQLAPEKNKLDAATIGDKGFSKLDMTLEIFIPGSYAVLHEAVKNLINTPLIALIKDSNCDADFYYQLGCDCASAWLTADFNTGTTKDGVKGYTGKLTYQNGYVQIYKGPSPTIKGATVVTAPTYDTTVDFTGNAIVTNAQNGVTAQISAPSSVVKVRYNKIVPQLQLPVRMDLKSGSTELLALTAAGDYSGKTIVYTDPQGVDHNVTFAAGDVQLT